MDEGQTFWTLRIHPNSIKTPIINSLHVQDRLSPSKKLSGIQRNSPARLHTAIDCAARQYRTNVRQSHFINPNLSCFSLVQCQVTVDFDRSARNILQQVSFPLSHSIKTGHANRHGSWMPSMYGAVHALFSHIAGIAWFTATMSGRGLSQEQDGQRSRSRNDRVQTSGPGPDEQHSHPLCVPAAGNDLLVTCATSVTWNLRAPHSEVSFSASCAVPIQEYAGM
ncbi:uncharacterized protein FOMMEDRAFT_153575 [Fomitiporia mediterranea MF3/22]|uniref:uncharacterized protein n=1 Tax=Fomitiporia mediterranea (strain MF3/22) TaxID=694068 RepID=UPI000440869D|nr:uncharacterized protein FOMMEDRAFT_153575 [Fomitiporia mediterranea MF3/22]EJD06176.1 hypothetical protein FOMMEDRAFT_153575 [Fomitiporia mediterranea MF3/22]